MDHSGSDAPKNRNTEGMAAPHDNSVAPPSPAHKEVVEIKVFASKALRRIRDMGRGPGSGKDGDGDGLTDDGTQYERPAAPAILKPAISEQWSNAYDQALARRTNAAKERIARIRKSGRQYRKEPYLSELDRAARNEDRDAAKKLAEGIFNHSSIGKDGAYSSIVTTIAFDPDDDSAGINAIQVGGEILDARGRPIGSFSRILVANNTFAYGEGKSGVYHDLLDLDEVARGKGVARDFLLESEIQYSLAGLETIGLTAGLDSGPWIWARDNYDWTSEEHRESHLSSVLRIVNLMAQNNQMNRDLARAYRDLFREALNEVFSEPERLRPIHLAYMPEFGKVQEAARLSGTPRYRFSWDGVRPVRPYRDMVMKEEE